MSKKAEKAVILLAEDEETDAYFVGIAFKKAGLPHSISHVFNGQQVIEYLKGEGRYADRANHPMPNLLLLDLKMPCVSGFDVLTWLRERDDLKDLPVVILTSSDYPADLEQAIKLGAADYRLKPSSPQQLVQFARDLHATWLTAEPKTQAPPRPVRSL